MILSGVPWLYDLIDNTDTAQLFTGEVNTESEELKSEPP